MARQVWDRFSSFCLIDLDKNDDKSSQISGVKSCFNELVANYYRMLTIGCGNKLCRNKICKSNPYHVQLHISSSAVSMVAIRLACENKVACCIALGTQDVLLPATIFQTQHAGWFTLNNFFRTDPMPFFQRILLTQAFSGLFTIKKSFIVSLREMFKLVPGYKVAITKNDTPRMALRRLTPLLLKETIQGSIECNDTSFLLNSIWSVFSQPVNVLSSFCCSVTDGVVDGNSNGWVAIPAIVECYNILLNTGNVFDLSISASIERTLRSALCALAMSKGFRECIFLGTNGGNDGVALILVLLLVITAHYIVP